MKGNKRYQNFEGAHIYPLNPSIEEIQLLEGEERLTEDVNDLDNYIALCGTCHTRFDHPRTVEEYRTLLELKKKLIQRRVTRNTYSKYDIESEIRSVLKKLANAEDSDIVPLEMSALRIDKKDNGTLEKLTKRRIKLHVVEYFNFVQSILNELDSESDGTFELIAMQIKSHSLKLSKDGLNQEQNYNSLVDWIVKRSGNYHSEACAIIVSFFVQNCEVFNASTK